jgi:trk system potassium uptake protein TrkA
MKSCAVNELPAAISVQQLRQGQGLARRCKIRSCSSLIGQKVFDIREKITGWTSSCARSTARGEIKIPESNDHLHGRRHRSMSSEIFSISRLYEAAGHIEHKVHSVAIIGGGKNHSFYLANCDIDMGIKVKIVEKVKERCTALNDALPQSLIINGTGPTPSCSRKRKSIRTTCSSHDPIWTRRISSFDARAKRRLKKVISKITRLESYNDIRDMGIDSVNSPKSITAQPYCAVLRAMQEYHRFKGRHACAHRERQVEVLEFTVAPNTAYQTCRCAPSRSKRPLSSPRWCKWAS